MTWDIETVVKITAPLLQAVSVAVTAYFAVRGLNAWRAQLIGKRKVEVAEEALLAAYKARNAISYKPPDRIA